MKHPILLAALAAALLGAAPAIAQQGPAGVPGVFGLVESVTAPHPAPPPTGAAHRQASPGDCASSAEQCRANQEARKKALAACAGKSGAVRKQCLSEYQQNQECKKAVDPALCQRHQKAHKLCAQKLGPEYRQCLRDILAPKN